MKQCVLVTASWCRACGPMKAYWNELSGLFPNVEFSLADMEQLPPLLEDLGICSLPAVVFIKDGEITGKSDGVKTKHETARLVESILEE